MTLVISEPSAAADRLFALLVADGIPARQVTPTEVPLDWKGAGAVPDMLLVNGSIEVELVRLALRRIMRVTTRRPTVVSFAEDVFANLEAHVVAGMDYVIPPYLPSQLRSRLIACHFRQAISRTAEEMQTAVDVLRYERDLQIGREIQVGFLPDRLPRRDGWQFVARFEPAREVAGDFYDAFDLRDGARLGLVVADVCDKGIGAALFMALVRSLLRHTATHIDLLGGEPEADEALLLRAVVATNDYLMTNHASQAYFATLFFGVLDPATGMLRYINCGHNPPVVRRADATDNVLLAPTGPALGLVADGFFGVGEVQLGPGDLLFAYTDGVPEARDEDGVFFTDKRMLELINAGQGDAEELVDRIDRAVAAHVGWAEPFDDITMIAAFRSRSS